MIDLVSFMAEFKEDKINKSEFVLTLLPRNFQVFSLNP